MTSKDFERAFARVIGHEGGFTRASSDPGNWTGGRIGSGTLKGTKYGISAASYPHLDIVNLTLGAAKDIYYSDYWQASGAAACPAGLDYAVFDSAVNNGVTSAAKFLQKAAGTTPDGAVGPKTLAAVAKASIKDPFGLLSDFQAHRTFHHMRITSMTKEYGLGWSRRLCDVLIDAVKDMQDEV